MAMFQVIGLFLSLAGATLLATRLWPVRQRSAAPDLNAASCIIVLAFIIYAEVLALGHLHWLSQSGLVLVNGLLTLALWSTRRAALADVRLVVQRLGLAFRDGRWLLLPVFFPLLVAAATPWQDGDTYGYHLPNLLHLLRQGTTYTAVAGALFDPGAATSYYPRGMEAFGAFFYFFALPHLTLLLFKSLLLAVLLLLFRAQQPAGLGAAFVFAVGTSLAVIQNDLGSLKNDLPLAVFFLYAYVVVTRAELRNPWLTLPVAMALALCLGMKSNALMYVVTVSLCWLWRAWPRCGRPVLLLTLVTLPWGLYFPLLNWWEHGSPFYPFGWQWLGRTIFPGAVLPGFETTLGGHLDGSALLLFLRGVLRQAGPVGVLLLATGLGWLLGRWMRRPMATPRMSPLRLVDYGAFALCGVFFLITPYSDNNGGMLHSQLFSGHTLRMALPALGLLGLMVVDAWPVAGRWCRPGIVFALALGLLLNGMAYDLTAMLLKPRNAWVQVAPLVRSFNNASLGLVTLMLAWLAAWACRCWRLPWLAALLVVAGVYQSFTWPGSLGYTLRFKQNGESSQAFTQVLSAVRADDTVALWAQGNNYFCACMYAVVAPRARAVHRGRNMTPAPQTSLVIQCADDVEQSKALVAGREHQIQRRDISSRMIGWGYAELYSDAFFSVWRKIPAPVRNKDA